MGAKRDEHLADRRIAGVATRQHGAVSRAQLVAAGLSRRQIERRIAAGRLHRLHRGVYAVGHRSVAVDGLRLAAVMSLGAGAVLSHRSAAAHWAIRASAATRIDVAVPCAGSRRSRDGLAVHRLSSLRPEQVTTHRGVPVTTPARTLLDLGAVVSRRSLERALDEVERLRLFDLTAFESVLSANRGNPGALALTTVLREHTAGVTLNRSELEERLLAICHEHGLERPLVNTQLLDFEVDFFWRDARLVVETDGHASHGTRAAFERDRARDAQLTLAGYRVVRFTHRGLREEPGQAAQLMAGLLDRPTE